MDLWKDRAERIKRRFSVREEGVLLVRCSVSYDRIDGADGYNSFCEELIANCEKWARETLGEQVRAEYNACEDKEKRFRFCGYEYSLCCQITEEDEQAFSVIIEASLWRKGNKSSNTARYLRRWRKSDLSLIPEKRLKVLRDKG